MLAPSASRGVAPTAAESIRMRLYDHTEHYEGVKDICKDVYGGHDYMPRLMEHYHQKRATTMVMVLVTDSDSPSAVYPKRRERVDAIAGAFLRGSLVFLFGLRVRTSLRGTGLGRRIMEEVCRHSVACFAAHAPESLATVTMMANLAAQRVIGATMPGAQMALLHMWPDSPVLHQYEQDSGWPEQPPQLPILQAVPGALEVLIGDAEAAQLVGQWHRLGIKDELDQALHDVRRAQAAASAAAAPALEGASTRGQGRGHGGSGGGTFTPLSAPDGTLPFFYEVFPVRCAWTEQQLAEGHVWALCGHGEEGAHPWLGAAAGWPCRHFRGCTDTQACTACIVACGQAVVHSALLMAAQLQPAFVAFLDLGCLYPPSASLASPALVPRTGHPPPPAVFAATGGARELLLYMDRTDCGSRAPPVPGGPHGAEHLK